MNRNAGHNAMKVHVLGFCGTKPVKISVFGSMKSADDNRRKKWMDEVEVLGKEELPLCLLPEICKLLTEGN